MQCIIRSTCLNNTGNCRRGKIPHLKALLKLHYPNEENYLLCEKCLGQQSYPMNSKWIIIHIPRIATILSYTQNHKTAKHQRPWAWQVHLVPSSGKCNDNLGTSNPQSGPGFGSKQKHPKIPTKIQPQQDAVGLFFGFVLGSYADIRHDNICKTWRKWFSHSGMICYLYHYSTMMKH